MEKILKLLARLYSNGNLTGYAGGIGIKAKLLELESADGSRLKIVTSFLEGTPPLRGEPYPTAYAVSILKSKSKSKPMRFWLTPRETS